MHTNVKKMAFVSVLAAMSFVLFFFPKFPLIAAFPWLDMDFSDVPALVASFTVSPLAGLSVVLIKNVLHLPMTTTVMVGELSNFLINGTFVFAAGLFYKYLWRHIGAFAKIILSMVSASACQIIAAALVNFFIMIPMYSAFVNFEELGGAKVYILYGVVPFNLIKDIAASLVFVFIFNLLNRKFHSFLNK